MLGGQYEIDGIALFVHMYENIVHWLYGLQQRS
jgi:hypothetical protein